MKPTNDWLAEQLRTMREEAGFTQSQLADVLKVSPAWVQRREGGATIRLEEAAMWAFVCRRSLRAYFVSSEYPTPKEDLWLRWNQLSLDDREVVEAIMKVMRNKRRKQRQRHEE